MGVGGNDGRSYYDSFQLSLRRQTRILQFNANYTLSKTIDYFNDDQIPFNGGEDAVNLIFRSNDLQLEKGYSPTDERHRFVLQSITLKLLHHLARKFRQERQIIFRINNQRLSLEPCELREI